MDPLLILVLGNVAQRLITEACEEHVKDKLKALFGWMQKLGERDKVELAYKDAMEQAFSACLEMLLLNIKGFGYTDQELREYKPSLKAFIKDDDVAEELLSALREPGRKDLPSPEVLRERWQAVEGQELPAEGLWTAVAAAFRRQAARRMILSEELRQLLNAQNLQQVRELIERQGGVKVQVRRDKYSRRMLTKFSPADLANLMPAYAEDPGSVVIRDVFVVQKVRENPPPVEIPKDLAARLGRGRSRKTGESEKSLDEQQLKKLRTAYVSQSPKPALEVITAPGQRLLVLTGEPGSGKSTFMRYLLTGILAPPVDRESGELLAWTSTFQGAFPLLIELRDFYARRRSGECDSFLEYVAYMGKTDQWFLDDHAADEYLENGPALVMFDGLDEIFDLADRQSVMHEIAGFAQRYPRARVIVTSRPVGYKEQVLRDAGFAHFGIQDLDGGQIETFVRGWFALTFPQHPRQAEQRIERVLGSVKQSKSIRLLAGNPMLLTIMALLAREEELPRERAKFYEKAVEVLCHHWDANRNLGLPEDRYLNADDKKDLLRRIAIRMQAGEGGLKGNSIQEDDLRQEIQAFLVDEQWQPNAAEAKRAARHMMSQLRERNYILCLRGPQLYGFVHRTFFEYLTAAEYVRRFDKQPQQMTFEELLELFDQHCRDDEWREVLRLICGQIDEQFVGQITTHLSERSDLERWSGESPMPELPLAILCLGEARNVARLSSAGKSLLDRVIETFRRAGMQVETYDFLSDLVAATETIGGRWPSQQPIENQLASQAEALGIGGKYFWPQFVAALVGESCLDDFIAASSAELRWGAIVAKAEASPDAETRALLINLAKEDNHWHPRQAALLTLVDRWPDDKTRELVEQRALDDQDEYPRSAALRALADKWPDDKTRILIEQLVRKDQNEYARRAALQALTDKWPDDKTRIFIEQRAQEDQNKHTRSTALRALADKWPDDKTRIFIEQRVQEDQEEYTRNAALQTLVDKWPDDRTREFLEQRARDRKNEYTRNAAQQALTDKWPDDKA